MVVVCSFLRAQRQLVCCVYRILVLCINLCSKHILYCITHAHYIMRAVQRTYTQHIRHIPDIPTYVSTYIICMNGRQRHEFHPCVCVFLCIRRAQTTVDVVDKLSTNNHHHNQPTNHHHHRTKSRRDTAVCASAQTVGTPCDRFPTEPPPVPTMAIHVIYVYMIAYIEHTYVHISHTGLCDRIRIRAQHMYSISSYTTLYSRAPCACARAHLPHTALWRAVVAAAARVVCCMLYAVCVCVYMCGVLLVFRVLQRKGTYTLYTPGAQRAQRARVFLLLLRLSLLLLLLVYLCGSVCLYKNKLSHARSLVCVGDFASVCFT